MLSKETIHIQVIILYHDVISLTTKWNGSSMNMLNCRVSVIATIIPTNTPEIMALIVTTNDSYMHILINSSFLTPIALKFIKFIKIRKIRKIDYNNNCLSNNIYILITTLPYLRTPSSHTFSLILAVVEIKSKKNAKQKPISPTTTKNS